jgi:hypothetical protein
MARTTPAWSAATCPTKLAAPNTYSLSTSVCGEERLEEDEERLEEDEERLEEELEVREDEEEERAIATERAARAATDAAEEATEEAQEQAGQQVTTSHSPDAKATLKLRVSVLRRRGHSLLRPGETRISVATSIPAQVRIVLQAHGGPVKLFKEESTEGRKYVLRVPWACHTQTQRYTLTITAYGKDASQIGARDVTRRRKTFTIDTPTICSKNQTPEKAGQHS